MEILYWCNHCKEYYQYDELKKKMLFTDHLEPIEEVITCPNCDTDIDDLVEHGTCQQCGDLVFIELLDENEICAICREEGE